MKSKPGIIIIALYFLFNGAFAAYQLIVGMLHGGVAQSNLFYSMIPIVFMVSGIGLFLKKEWGWNLTVLAAGCYLLLGVLKAAAYLSQENDIKFLIKGGIDILLALCIIGYMSRKTIKGRFEKSPISLMCIGTFLLLSRVTHMFAIQILDTIFRMIALLVGVVVMFKAKQQLREQGDSTTLIRPPSVNRQNDARTILTRFFD